MNKNGKAELYRFLFSMIVLLFHCDKYFHGGVSFNNGVHISLFGHGAVAVEFFFILSGFLMAKSVFKKLNDAVPAEKFYKKYIAFMRHKYTGIYPVHAAAFVTSFISAVLMYGFKRSQIGYYFLDSLPNLFLVEMSGIRFRDPNHIEWYISCMLIGMAILYPILRRHFYAFTHYLAPVFSLLAIGFMIHETESLTGVMTWMGFCYKSLLRALCDLALGTTCFEISRAIAAKSFTRRQKAALTVSEWSLLIVAVVFALLTLPKQYEAFMPFVFVVMLAVSFSGQSGIARIWNNHFIYHLGKISLPIYVGQLTAIYLVRTYVVELSPTMQILAATALTFGIAYLLLFVTTVPKRIAAKRSAKNAAAE